MNGQAVRILVTAGPTHEPIDAVRYLANRSSGRLGVAIAEAARHAGAQVTLLLGPTDAAPPADVAVERFESTAELERLLAGHLNECDVLVMAAAVADYRPSRTGQGKIARQGRGLTLELEATPDLVAEASARRRPGQMIIGFALEQPERLAERAQHKLADKGLDAIVANPLSTMGAADIDATVFTADAEPRRPGAMSKRAFAKWLVEWIMERWVRREQR